MESVRVFTSVVASALTLSAGIGIAGCTSSGNDSNTNNSQAGATTQASYSPPPLPKEWDETSLIGPLTRYVYSKSDMYDVDYKISETFNKVYDACAAQNQMTVTPYDKETSKRDDISYATGESPELLVTNARKAYGYDITSYLVSDRNNEAGTPLKPNDGNSEVVDKCGNEAQTAFDKLDISLKPYYNLRDDIEKRVDGSPDMATALKAWTKCMSDKGYVNDDPHQTSVVDPSGFITLDLEARSRDLQHGSAQAKALHKEELKAAQDDYTCRTTTLYPTRFTLSNQLEQEVLDKNLQAMTELRDKLADFEKTH